MVIRHMDRDGLIAQYAKNKRISLEEAREAFDRADGGEYYWDNPHVVGEAGLAAPVKANDDEK